MALAFAALSASAAPAAPLRDLGVVAPSTTISTLVWLKGSNDAALDVAAEAVHDSASPSYHQWLQDADIAAFKPTAQDLANARASLSAQGLSVDKVLDGGSFVRVSGSAEKLQAAFGTTIHAVQGGTGRTLFKAATKPIYQGAHAELIGGVSGLGGSAPRPFVARAQDLATGQALPFVTPQAGTDPLAGFTQKCFGPTFTATMSGFSQVIGAAGHTVSTATGPTYLDPTKLVGRPYCAYTAQQLVAHYGVDEAHAVGLKGRGQTIVIVDAYGSPTALKDLNAFSQVMGLPTAGSNNFEVVYPDGQPNDADDGAADWAIETTLDIQWAHAFAPEAKIVLMVAPSNDNAELAYAVAYAADHHLGNVLSNSWGYAEVAGDPDGARMFDHVFKQAAARGVAVNVATGDEDDNGVGSPLGATGVPADSPYATAIGGTSINIPSDNGPVESAWGLAVTHFGNRLTPDSHPVLDGTHQGGVGGESVYFRKPGWQRKLPGTGRQTPDISAIADPQTGAIIAITDPGTGNVVWGSVGGTSLATPIFSAIWALADEAAGESLGQAAPVIAALPPFAVRDVLPVKATKNTTTAAVTFRDVLTNYSTPELFGFDPKQKTSFFSALVYVGATPFEGWNAIAFGLDASLTATVGWDNATGYGVPNGLLFIESAQFFARHH